MWMYAHERLCVHVKHYNIYIIIIKRKEELDYMVNYRNILKSV